MFFHLIHWPLRAAFRLAKKQEQDISNDVAVVALVAYWIALLFVGLFLTSIVFASFEAAAFNRATGAHVSTWDALWIDLKVISAPANH